ncbi:MAG: hypothetical protein DRO05_05650 [Thermoproteota archaeon]|nr:MAG: hypothetical protein DRO05_05650 [Candidatus Korarchaeota archaeon]
MGGIVMESSLSYALYLGCMIANEEYAYEMSAREVMRELGVELVDLEGESCCGSPIRSLNTKLWLYLAARNLSLAEKTGLDVLCLCSGCFESLLEAKHFLDSERGLKNWVNRALALEGLEYTGKCEVKHLVQVLHDDLGVEVLRKRVKRELKGLKLVSHPGCHLLRPSRVLRADDPEDPRKLDELIKASGADVIDYPEKLDCCGAGLLLMKPEGTLSFAGAKLKSLAARGVDGLVTVCPACHLVFDKRQGAISRQMGIERIPVIYYPQLLGLAFGIEPEKLGIHLNSSPVEKILSRI